MNVLIWKIIASIWFRWMKKETSSLTEHKRKDKAQRAYTHRNPERHIPLVSLLLWRKMVAVRYFVWPLALQLWSVSQAKIRVLEFKKHILYLAACNCFVIINAVLYIIWSSTIP